MRTIPIMYGYGIPQCFTEKYPALLNAKRWINVGQSEETPSFKNIFRVKWFAHTLENILKDESKENTIETLAKLSLAHEKNNIKKAHQNLNESIQETDRNLENQSRRESTPDLTRLTQTSSIRGLQEREQEINRTDDTTLEHTLEIDEEQQSTHGEEQVWYKHYASTLLSSFIEKIRTAKALALSLFEPLTRLLLSSSNRTNERTGDINREILENRDLDAFRSNDTGGRRSSSESNNVDLGLYYQIDGGNIEPAQRYTGSMRY